MLHIDNDLIIEESIDMVASTSLWAEDYSFRNYLLERYDAGEHLDYSELLIIEPVLKLRQKLSSGDIIP